MTASVPGLAFAFVPPEGWSERRQGARLIFEGPDGEVLQISGAPLPQGAAAREDALSGLVENGLATIREAASDPDLAEVLPLQRVLDTPQLMRWETAATSDEGATVFAQALVASPKGVLLATIFGPADPTTIATFGALLASVKAT
jgi:hypothetical protein